MRKESKELIVRILKEMKTPMNCYQIMRTIEKRYKKKIAYWTIHKYIKELMDMNNIEIAFSSKSINKKNFPFYRIRP